MKLGPSVDISGGAELLVHKGRIAQDFNNLDQCCQYPKLLMCLEN